MRIVAMILCALTILAGERVSADSSMFNGIQQAPSPDMLFVAGSLACNSGTDVSTINSTVGDNMNVPNGEMSNGNFSLTDDIAATPELDGQAISGLLDIDGVATGRGFAGNPLLTGTLTAFRSNNFNQMEFLFTVTGGETIGLYGGVGAVGVVVVSSILTTPSNFGSNFTSDFFADNVLMETAVPVPEPGSFLLAVLSVVGVVGVVVGTRLRRKRRHQS